MSKMRSIALFLSVILAATVLSACGDKKPAVDPGSDENSASGAPSNEIVVAIAQDLADSLDPYLMAAAGTREVLFNVYEGLMKPNSDGEFIGAVASDYTMSDDGLTYTFPLREGVKFHNGADVTAQDVIDSFETCAATTVDTALAAALSGIQEISASEDGKTITITLQEPNGDFISYVASTYIVPSGYKENATAPVGTGPFRFVSHAVQESVVLEKFSDYWGTPASLDKVTYKVYEDANAMMSALNAGSVDLAAHLSTDQVKTLDTNTYNVVEGTMNLVQALYLNHKVEPFNNEKVRQAMCYAVDVDQMLQMTADGHGTKVGTSMYPAFTKYFDASLADAYPHDVEKAKALLKEAGYPDGFTMTISVPNNYTPHVNTAEVLVEQLKEVGINAAIQLVEWETWLNDIYMGRNFASTVVGFDATSLTPGAMLNRWISTDDKNMINYNNPEYDAVMAQAAASTEDTQRTQLYKDAAKMLSDTAANVYLQDLADMVVMKKELTGYTPYPLYVIDMSTIHYAN